MYKIHKIYVLKKYYHNIIVKARKRKEPSKKHFLQVWGIYNNI